MPVGDILYSIRRAGALLRLAALFAAALAATPGLAATSGPPPGTARIWIYRVFDPTPTTAIPNVRLNGAVTGRAQLGVAFYRDVPPGDYRITADSRGEAPDQFARVALAAGDTVYVKVDANNWWAGAGCQPTIVTFYTLVVWQQLARADMAPLKIVGG